MDALIRYGDHPAYLRIASNDRLLPVFYLYDSYRFPTSCHDISPMHTSVLLIEQTVLSFDKIAFLRIFSVAYMGRLNPTAVALLKTWGQQ